VVKVIWHKAASPPQTDASVVFARWRQCALPRGHIGATWRIWLKLCFDTSAYPIHNPNGKSIGSSVFVGFYMADRQTDHATRSVTIGRIYVRSTDDAV